MAGPLLLLLSPSSPPPAVVQGARPDARQALLLPHGCGGGGGDEGPADAQLQDECLVGALEGQSGTRWYWCNRRRPVACCHCQGHGTRRRDPPQGTHCKGRSQGSHKARVGMRAAGSLLCGRWWLWAGKASRPLLPAAPLPLLLPQRVCLSQECGSPGE